MCNERNAETQKASGYDASAPLSGGALGRETGVSRQVVVQDIALLRTMGYPILSTARGYVLNVSKHASRFFKVCHTNEQTEDELVTIVDLGGTVVFGETTEFLGAEHILKRRAVNAQVADKIDEIVARMESRAKSLGCDMRKGQPTPGNIEGGLSSIEEKSLGAIVKSGTRPIQGVMEYTDRVGDRKGLWIKDTPGREPEILTGMACTGAQLMMFSTGRGAPQGFPTMPVVKVCGNPITYRNMENDMDINAGLIIEGKKSIEQVGEEVFEKIVEVLNGGMSKNESLHYYSSIDIYTLGPVI